MALVTVGVTSNQQLHDAVLEAVRGAQESDPFRPVTLIANSAAQGWEMRRQLIAGLPNGTAVANLRVLTLAEFMDHCRLLLDSDAVAVDRLVRAVAVEQLLRTETGALANSAAHPDTARLITGIAEDLAWCDFDDTVLSSPELQPLTTATSRAALAFVLRMRAQLRGPAAITDHSSVSRRALAADAQQVLRLCTSLGAVVCTEQSLPLAAQEILQRLADAGESIVRVELAPAAQLPAATRVVSAPDPATEAAIAVRAVAAHIASGVAPDRIALLYSASDPYAALLDAALAAAHIEWRGPTADALETLALPQAALLLTGMAVARTDTVSGITRRTLMRWLAVGSITLDGVSVQASRLRGFIRDANLHGDARGWLVALDEYRAPEVPEGEEPDQETQRSIDAAGHAHQLAALIRALDAGLAALTASNSWAMAGAALHRLIVGFHGELSATSTDVNERSAAPMLRALLLESLPRIDAHVAGAGAPAAADVLAVLERQFIGRRTRHGRTSAGVHVGPLASARALTFDAVVVIGAAEGSLPAINSSDTVLTDPLRRALRRDPADLPTAPEAAAAVATEFHALLAPAAHVLTTFPRTGVSGVAEGFASPLLKGLDAVEAPSANAELAHAEALIADADIAVRAALAGAGDDEVLAPQRAAVFAWMNPALGPLFGAVGAAELELLPALDAKPLSASGIEQYLGCPYQFLVERVLKVNADTVTDELEAMEAKDFGTLVHEVLESFVDLARKQGLLPNAGEPWPDEAQALLRALLRTAIDEAASKGQLGWLPAWADRERQLFEALPGFFAADHGLRAERGTNPHASELGFGIPGSPDVHFALSDGTRIPLRGFIDRVDVDEPDAPDVVDIIDYKTGKLQYFVKGLKPDADGRRKKVQDLVYSVAARELFPGAQQLDVHFFFVPNAGEPAVHHADHEDAEGTLRGILDELQGALTAGRFRPSGPANTFCPVCKALGRRAARFTGDTGEDDE